MELDRKFVGRLGAGILGGVIDGVIEAPFNLDPTAWTGKFPYIDVAWPLPPADDLIVTGICAAPLIYGIAAKDDRAKEIGLGMSAWGIPMFIHHTMVRLAWGPPPPAVGGRAGLVYIPTTGEFVPTRPGLSARIKYGPEQRVVTAPKFIPGVLGAKYQHGA